MMGPVRMEIPRSKAAGEVEGHVFFCSRAYYDVWLEW